MDFVHHIQLDCFAGDTAYAVLARNDGERRNDDYKTMELEEFLKHASSEAAVGGGVLYSSSRS